ncbi:hypothetical protein KI387_027075, partial [Taxus chinensis]
MHDKVIHALKDETNPQHHHLGYCDNAWSVNKIAHVARKQGLFDVCVTVLNKMYVCPAMEVQEAFVKLREQAKACLEMRGELTNGINLINNTDLEYFSAQHKAEIFRLKGEFSQKLGDDETAYHAYSEAICLSKNLSEGWISWGNYCDQMYKETKEEISLEHAVTCFLEGIKYGVSNARSYLARVLYLLSFDTPNEPVGKTFDKYLDHIPHWVWLSWIPQLLNSLQRPEAAHCKLVLLRLATVYPQALYYLLRTYLLERCELANKSELERRAASSQKRAQQITAYIASSASINSVESNLLTSNTSSSNLPSDFASSQVMQLSVSHDCSNVQGQESGKAQQIDGDVPTGSESSQTNSASINDSQARIRHNAGLNWGASAATAVDAAMDVTEFLKNKHTNLADELEVFVTEISTKFGPSPEERLLALVNALLHRCYIYPIATTAEVPQSLKNELSGACRAYFPADKHVEFVNEYKRNFECDFHPGCTSTFPSRLSDLTRRLKNWMNVLQGNIEDRMPIVLKLEEESRALCEFHVVDMEVPGQYFSDQDIAPNHTVKLDMIGADVPVIRRHGSSFRRLTIVGSDGSQRHFLVHGSLMPSARSNERVVQLFHVLNRLFDKHKESRRRHLTFNTPVIIPVCPQVCMVEDDLMYSTFGEVYEINCARNGREADLPITHFKERLNYAMLNQLSSESTAAVRLHACSEITESIVSTGIFSRYMYKTLPSCNHLWAFKKQFAIQLALSGFMSYVLQIGRRSPNKTLFAKNTGKVLQIDFHPDYGTNGMIEYNEPVPFRLTPNLQTLFTPFCVEGLFVSSICAAAQSIAAPKSQYVQHHLAMFFRDELLSLSWSRLPGMPSTPDAAGSISPLEFEHKVKTNVEKVLERLQGIAPQNFTEE